MVILILLCYLVSLSNAQNFQELLNNVKATTPEAGLNSDPETSIIVTNPENDSVKFLGKNNSQLVYSNPTSHVFNQNSQHNQPDLKYVQSENGTKYDSVQYETPKLDFDKLVKLVQQTTKIIAEKIPQAKIIFKNLQDQKNKNILTPSQNYIPRLSKLQINTIFKNSNDQQNEKNPSQYSHLYENIESKGYQSPSNDIVDQNRRSFHYKNPLQKLGNILGLNPQYIENQSNKPVYHNKQWNDIDYFTKKQKPAYTNEQFTQYQLQQQPVLTNPPWTDYNIQNQQPQPNYPFQQLIETIYPNLQNQPNGYNYIPDQQIIQRRTISPNSNDQQNKYNNYNQYQQPYQNLESHSYQNIPNELVDQNSNDQQNKYNYNQYQQPYPNLESYSYQNIPNELVDQNRRTSPYKDYKNPLEELGDILGVNKKPGNSVEISAKQNLLENERHRLIIYDRPQSGYYNSPWGTHYNQNQSNQPINQNQQWNGIDYFTKIQHPLHNLENWNKQFTQNQQSQSIFPFQQVIQKLNPYQQDSSQLIHPGIKHINQQAQLVIFGQKGSSPFINNQYPKQLESSNLNQNYDSNLRTDQKESDQLTQNQQAQLALTGPQESSSFIENQNSNLAYSGKESSGQLIQNQHGLVGKQDSSSFIENQYFRPIYPNELESSNLNQNQHSNIPYTDQKERDQLTQNQQAQLALTGQQESNSIIQNQNSNLAYFGQEHTGQLIQNQQTQQEISGQQGSSPFLQNQYSLPNTKQQGNVNFNQNEYSNLGFTEQKQSGQLTQNQHALVGKQGSSSFIENQHPRPIYPNEFGSSNLNQNQHSNIAYGDQKENVQLTQNQKVQLGSGSLIHNQQPTNGPSSLHGFDQLTKNQQTQTINTNQHGSSLLNQNIPPESVHFDNTAKSQLTQNQHSQNLYNSKQESQQLIFNKQSQSVDVSHDQNSYLNLIQPLLNRKSLKNDNNNKQDNLQFESWEDEDGSEEVLEDRVKPKLVPEFGSNRRSMHSEEAAMITPELIQKYGYPGETYSVTTEDGYILKMHRIPWGIRSPACHHRKKPVVFLMHDIISSSSDFIINGPDQSLAYILADAGYDVWMGNARGNRYSRNHQSLVPSNTKFWDFTWHEIGYYDVPAMIDFALNMTEQPKLYYIGHSQGTTVYYVMTSERPEYNDKIIASFHLAPIAYLTHMISPLLRFFALFANQIGLFFDVIGVGEFLPKYDLLTQLGHTFCKERDFTQFFCTSPLFILSGYNKQNLNETRLPLYMGHTPAGGSTKQFIHYGQIVNSGVFRQFNLGPANLLKYGSLYAPSYDLNKCTAPIVLIYSLNGFFSRKTDVDYLYRKLPNAKTLEIEDPKFGHIDFLFGMNAKKVLYDDLLKMMQNY